MIDTGIFSLASDCDALVEAISACDIQSPVVDELSFHLDCLAEPTEGVLAHAVSAKRCVEQLLCQGDVDDDSWEEILLLCWSKMCSVITQEGDNDGL